MPRIFEAPPGFVLNPDYLVPELRAQRDLLLEALKALLSDYDSAIDPGESKLIDKARAAIKAVEGEKT